ncbi:MAG: 23S rRNA pseudouridine(1911/1915/1917) synthase RluD [Gammaproteobacteria bacterium]|nr:MAG: 23S rRNA pseudouridine(1911/1915/1917) synthase RluD [Gammaproteobacteria bacterium]
MNTTQYDAAIPAELDGKRLDQALAAMFPDYSRSRLKEWILAGLVTVDGATSAPRTRIRTGQQVALTVVLEVRESAGAEPMTLNIVFEDDDLLLIDKPAGLVVHPGAGNPAGTLMNGLLHHAPDLATLPRSGILHRLDKDTSGLLLVAKTLVAHTRLVRDLQERAITREYRGICVGCMTAGGHVDAPIGRHKTNRTRQAVTDRGRPAVTHYRVLTKFPAHTFLALRLETGRTHQIRVHMAHRRHPLVGDPAYGGRLKIPGGGGDALGNALRALHRQALHACRIGFRHPTDARQLQFQSALPADLTALLDALATAAGKRVADGKWDRMEWPVQQAD